MERNVGPEDRVVRIVVGLVLAVIIYLGYLEGVAAVVAGIAAAYLVVTGIIVRDPLYKAVGIDTAVQEQPYSDTDDRAGI